jgi:RNA polymerase sigma-70 factor (ECF subfamily)
VANDPTAAQVFARHHRDIYRYLARMTGSPDDADELVQEVFLRVVRGLQNGGPIGHERGWVFAIAHHLLFDANRKSHRTIRLEPSLKDGSRQEPRQQATQTLVLALRQALESLQAPDRDAFLLKELAGLSYEEIATASGGTIESVRSRLYRVRATLRKTLSMRFAL